ncbi:MAG: hypothetical protein LBI42_01225 [Chitinispirillales bacterium]|jgi:hypothetical protein|nr:hypothetical protein [Chitinispirillales bacterium]
MSLSKIKCLAVVLTIAAAISAQTYEFYPNARTAALAGAKFADISDISRYPVCMLGYENHMQATYGNGYPITVTKSLSEMIHIGFLANQGPVSNGFLDYVDGNPFLPLPADESHVNIPHLLLGVNLGTFKIGADLFFEYANANSHIKDNNNNIEDKRDGSLLNPGARLSAGLDLESVMLLAKFGLGFPSVNYERTVDGTTTAKVASEKGSYLEMGAEAAFSISDLDMSAGLVYTTETYQFKSGVDPVVLDGMYPSISAFQMYLDCRFNILETAEMAAGYAFTRVAFHTKNNANKDDKDWRGFHVHRIPVGLENTWENAWIFDAVSLRAGARYNLVIDVEKSDINKVENSIKYLGTHTITPTFGFGVSKSFLQLDMALGMDNWQGAFVGPAVGLVTATIKY